LANELRATVPFRARPISPSTDTQPQDRETSRARANSSPAGILPDGARETEPLLLMLIAIVIPVGLVTLAALGGGIPLLVLAIATMLLVCGGLAMFLKRLTTSVPADEGPSHRSGRSPTAD
jgi:hypothetical protein